FDFFIPRRSGMTDTLCCLTFPPLRSLRAKNCSCILTYMDVGNAGVVRNNHLRPQPPSMEAVCVILLRLQPRSCSFKKSIARGASLFEFESQLILRETAQKFQCVEQFAGGTNSNIFVIAREDAHGGFDDNRRGDRVDVLTARDRASCLAAAM